MTAAPGREGVRIRGAAPADRPALLDLLSRQLTEHGVHVPAPELGAAIDGVQEVPGRGLFLVAEASEAAIVGFAYLAFNWTLEHSGRCAWLEELYVRPEHRGGGVGTLLLEAAIAACRRHGCRAIDLEVEEDHRRVEALYVRHGFEPRTRRRWALRLPRASRAERDRPGPEPNP